MRDLKFFAVTVSLVVAVPTLADTVGGYVYRDVDGSSRSAYVQEFGSEDAAMPGVDVALLGFESERTTVTSASGRFAFADVGDGRYLLDVDVPDTYRATSTNHPRRMMDAVRSGHVKIVAVGDSIGATGSDPYPERLGAILDTIVETEVVNLHVGGSASWDWLPGSSRGYFENRLLPELADADLVTITVGGNDLDIYLPPGGPPYDPLEIFMNFLDNPQYVVEVIPRVVDLVEAIQSANPDCDVLYAVYPNFANSSYIAPYVGDLADFASWVLDLALRLVRGIVGATDGVLLADMLAAHDGEWLDDYLIDEVHPSDLGSQVYAEVMFRALGGVTVREGRRAPAELSLFGFDGDDRDVSKESPRVWRAARPSGVRPNTP
ncbi:MAG: GDSL-type esterase/lipase family protein [Deltaproteobacteria bacterium]|nr:GDSL-type esterase/lipase family protein [Deltaproteobacteria bacterium]